MSVCSFRRLYDRWLLRLKPPLDHLYQPSCMLNSVDICKDRLNRRDFRAWRFERKRRKGTKKGCGIVVLSIKGFGISHQLLDRSLVGAEYHFASFIRRMAEREFCFGH